jgi:tRNA 2-thiouridine synthesizing protein E
LLHSPHNTATHKAGFNMLCVDNKTIETDKEGYLKNLSDWSEHVAHAIAEQEGITLTDAHWEIIQLLKTFYNTYELSPSMRVLVKTVAKELGEFKGRSIYLSQLFPRNVIKQSCKIAGLPKPTNCV